MPNQELDVSVPYREGAVRVDGSTSGHGYVEMTGYGDSSARALSRPDDDLSPPHSTLALRHSQLTVETLNLPTYEFRTVERDGKRIIYDPVRQTYVRLTPEEWVRQHFVQYLIQELAVPGGLVAVEASFEYQGQPQRADVIVHDRQGEPILLVECKAPHTPIDQDAFNQCARYNIVLNAPYLVVTNGQTHYACTIDFEDQSYTFLDDLPPYDHLLSHR